MHVLQCGFPRQFWPLVAHHWKFAKSATTMGDQLSPYAKLHGTEYDGLKIPFSALVIYEFCRTRTPGHPTGRAGRGMVGRGGGSGQGGGIEARPSKSPRA